jgi:regulator of sigma E protease
MTIWTYVVPFLIVLTILVFVHEYGHYIVARWNGVRVDVFSVGFGKELFGYTDSAGTRWKFSLLPLGGYVKMHGDADASSSTVDQSTALDPDSFPAKNVLQRMSIIVAGPLANILFAAVALAFLFAIVGRPFTPAVVGKVEEGSPAAIAGLMT